MASIIELTRTVHEAALALRNAIQGHVGAADREQRAHNIAVGRTRSEDYTERTLASAREAVGGQPFDPVLADTGGLSFDHLLCLRMAVQLAVTATTELGAVRYEGASDSPSQCGMRTTMTAQSRLGLLARAAKELAELAEKELAAQGTTPLKAMCAAIEYRPEFGWRD